MKALRDSSFDHLLVAAITLLAAWLRLSHLGEPSLWWDEFITIGASARPLADMLRTLRDLGPSDISVELFPPLYHILVHALMQLGPSDVLMRLPGALFGVATVPAVYLLTRGPLGRASALLAALVTALSVYHLHYSREVRPYPLLMLENILALHLLFEGVCGRRRAMLAGYAGMALAMLYTSYMAATLIAGQLAFAGLALGARWAERPKERGDTLKDALTLSSALALAAACYLPWAKGQLNVFNLLRDPGFSPGFTWDFVQSSLQEFAAFAYQGHFPVGLVLGGLGVVGLGLALSDRKARSLALLCCLWTLVPILGIFMAKARMELSSRYIFPAFFTLSIFAAHAVARLVDKLADRLFGATPPIFIARLAVGLAACLLLMRPNMESLNAYYSREISFYKQAMIWLAENKDNKDLVLFYHPRNAKMVYHWYAPGLYQDARNLAGAGYHRAYMLAPAGQDVAKHVPGARLRTTVRDDSIWELGLLRRAVVPVTPDQDGRFIYFDDFSTLQMLEDVARADNLAPSLTRKTLTTYDAGLPATGAYRFALPEGRAVRRAMVRLACSTQLMANLPTDAKLELFFKTADAAPVKIFQADLASFSDSAGRLVPPNHEGKRFADFEADLTGLAAGAGGTLELGLNFSKGTSGGAVEVENFLLELVLDGPPGNTPSNLLAGYQAAQAAAPMAPWTPGTWLVASRALHAFSENPAISAKDLGGPADLATYMAGHPGEKPVARIADGDSPAIVFFDPALHLPYLPLQPGKPLAVSASPETPRVIRGLKIRGALNSPVLTVAGQPLTLPLTCPAPAYLSINPGETGRLLFAPLFTQAGLDLGAAAHSPNIGRNQDEDCLSCQDDKPCSITYAVRSGLPITHFRLRAYPRIYSDARLQNAVITSYSLDGVNFFRLAGYTSSGSGRWEGLKVPQFSFRLLDKPSHNLFIRFELSGPKAQLWSAPDARMRLTLTLDASQVRAPQISSWPSHIAADQPLEALVYAEPIAFVEKLRRSR